MFDPLTDRLNQVSFWERVRILHASADCPTLFQSIIRAIRIGKVA